MKTALVALLTMISFSAFAQYETQPETRVRYNCFYKDSYMNYTHGAIGFTESRAKGQARLDCQNFLNSNDYNGQCTFAGCRTLNSLSIEQ